CDSVQDAIAFLRSGRPAHYVLLDQHCADFDPAIIARELAQQNPENPGNAFQPILLLNTGACREPFDSLQPAPWFEEFPVSIDRLRKLLKPPAAIAQSSADSTAAPTKEADLNVLVVDDNSVNLMVVTGYLRKLGIQPTVVDSGKMA